MTVTQIQLRRDTAIDWTNANPILLLGEVGIETDTLKMKVGDGATHWATLDYMSGGGGSSSGIALNVMDYGAVGDGVTNDTAAIQAAINAANALYVTPASSAVPSNSTIVFFPSGKTFKSSRLIILPGVTLWAYGATIQATLTGWTNKGFLTFRPSGNPPATGTIITDFAVRGGLWRGTGLETFALNQYWLEIPDVAGVRDFVVKDCTVTGWGMDAIKLQNPTRSYIDDNCFYGNEVAGNPGFQNMINIFLENTSAFSGEFSTSRNRFHNVTANSIDVIVGLLSGTSPANGRMGWICDGNIVTCDAPRIDTDGVAGATVLVTSGSAVVTDSACTSADVGKYVTGPKIPNVTYIASFTAGSPNTFTMSKNATGGGTGTSVSVGVYKSTIALESDSGPTSVSDFTIVNNDVRGYERGVIAVALPNGHTATRGIIANNRIENLQTGTPVDPQGNGIKVSGQTAVADVSIINNRIDAPNPIVISGSSFSNTGVQSGNKLSTGAIQGRAVLVAGTVTVSTTEIQTGDNVILSRVVTGGTTGNLSLGTIVNETSFDINSSGGSDTSTVYWKIDH